jgi:hypothetical protein
MRDQVVDTARNKRSDLRHVVESDAGPWWWGFVWTACRKIGDVRGGERWKRGGAPLSMVSCRPCRAAWARRQKEETAREGV